MAAKDEIVNMFETLIGLECRSATWGRGTGSVIDVGFGPMEPRLKPLTNPSLSERDRNFSPEFSLMLWCAWRIRENGDVLVGWRDAELNDRSVFDRASEIVGKKVVNVLFDQDSGDVRLELADGYRLDVFCDVTNEDEGSENYILFTPFASFTVGFGGEVVKEIKDTKQ